MSINYNLILIIYGPRLYLCSGIQQAAIEWQAGTAHSQDSKAMYKHMSSEQIRPNSTPQNCAIDGANLERQRRGHPFIEPVRDRFK